MDKNAKKIYEMVKQIDEWTAVLEEVNEDYPTNDVDELLLNMEKFQSYLLSK